MENSMTSFERSRKRRSLLTLTFAKQHTSKKVLDIMQRCDMRLIAYMNGYVFPAGCTNFRPLGFSLLAGWKGVTSFERSRKRRCLFCWPWPFNLLTSWWNRRYVGVDGYESLCYETLQVCKLNLTSWKFVMWNSVIWKVLWVENLQVGSV